LQDEILFQGEKGEHRAYVSGYWDDGLKAYDFNVSYGYYGSYYDDINQKIKLKVVIFSDRPIYRPPSKVYFKGIVKH